MMCAIYIYIFDGARFHSDGPFDWLQTPFLVVLSWGGIRFCYFSSLNGLTTDVIPSPINAPCSNNTVVYVCLIGLTTKKKSEAVTNWSTMSAVPFRRPPRGVKQSDSARSTHWRRAGPFTWHSFSLFHWPWARIWRAVAGAVPGRPVYWSAWFTKCSKTSSLSTAKWATSTATSCCAKPGATSATTSPSDCCLHGGGATAQSTKTTTSVNRPKRKSRLTRRRKRRRKNGSHGYDPTISHVPLFLRSSFRKLLGQTRRAVGYCLVKMQKAMGNAISVKW